jgi:long-chain acyl-CoA synthetase
MKFVVSGGAPADAELGMWMKAAFNLEFYQGYGLTESYGAVASQTTEKDLTTIGHLWGNVEGRIVSVPELVWPLL